MSRSPNWKQSGAACFFSTDIERLSARATGRSRQRQRKRLRAAFAAGTPGGNPLPPGFSFPLNNWSQTMTSKFVTILFIALAASYTVIRLANPEAPAKAATAETSSAAGASLAGTFVNLIKYCPNDFAALTPQHQDAVQVFVQREISDHGFDVIDRSAARKYENGYYKIGDRWCSSAVSTAKSVARAMTR
jgi:hypothetical protein